MNDRALIAHVFPGNGGLSAIALAERREILDRLWGDFPKETQDYPSYYMAVDGYFQKDSFRYEGQCSVGGANRVFDFESIEKRKNNRSF